MHPIIEKYNQINAFGKLMGMSFKILKPGEVEYYMKITENLLSNPAAAHGGAVAAMMDGVMGVAALSLSAEENKLVSTVEFKINYFAPIQLNDKLFGKGKVIFHGKRLLTCEGNIYLENRDMKLVCKGLGTFNAYPVEKNLTIGNFK